MSGLILGVSSYALSCTINGQEFTWQGFALSAAMGAATVDCYLKIDEIS